MKKEMKSRGSNTSCIGGVCTPKTTQGSLAKVAKGSKTRVIRLEGPGVFLAAKIVKQGGSSGLTFVTLKIDGNTIASWSYAAIENWGLSAHNNFGVALLPGRFGLETLVLGYQTPLLYKKYLEISIQVKENGVQQILTNVTHGNV